MQTTPYDSPATEAKDLGEIPSGTPQRGCQRWRRFKMAIFDQYLAISQKKMQNMAIVTMEGKYEIVCALSNGATSNVLE